MWSCRFRRGLKHLAEPLKFVALAHERQASAMSAFEELGICPEIIQAVEEARYSAIKSGRSNCSILSGRPENILHVGIWLSHVTFQSWGNELCLRLLDTSTQVRFELYLLCSWHICQDDWLLPTPVQQEAAAFGRFLEWFRFGII